MLINSFVLDTRVASCWAFPNKPFVATTHVRTKIIEHHHEQLFWQAKTQLTYNQPFTMNQHLNCVLAPSQRGFRPLSPASKS